MKKIIHLVNPNGLGHLRRSIFIWNNNKLTDLNVKICIDISQVMYLNLFNPINQISFEIMDLSGMITLKNIKNKSFVKDYFNFHNYIKKFAFIKNADLIVSDNTLIDFNAFSKNYLVIGSFLWHDIIKHKSELLDVFNHEITLLKKNKPCIYGINGFLHGSLIEYNFSYGLGWLVNNKASIKVKSNNSKLAVLFSGGLGDMKSDVILKIVQVLLKKDIEIYHSINYKFIQVSKIFDFNNDWDKIDFVIARPGIGTISDCVENQVPIVAIGEKSNSEIAFNALKITQFNLGFDYVNNPFNLNFLSKKKKIKFNNINRNGLKEIEKIINEKLHRT